MREATFPYFLKVSKIFSDKNNHLPEWKDLKINFSRPLFTIIFRPEIVFLDTDFILRLKKMYESVKYDTLKSFRYTHSWLNIRKTEFWGESTAFHFTQWTIPGPGIRIRGDPPNQPPPSKDPEHVLNAYPHPEYDTWTCSATSSKECAGSTSLFANCW